ncbi:unnamed protein product, partial [Allacma fusca]
IYKNNFKCLACLGIQAGLLKRQQSPGLRKLYWLPNELGNLGTLRTLHTAYKTGGPDWRNLT